MVYFVLELVSLPQFLLQSWGFMSIVLRIKLYPHCGPYPSTTLPMMLVTTALGVRVFAAILLSKRLIVAMLLLRIHGLWTVQPSSLWGATQTGALRAQHTAGFFKNGNTIHCVTQASGRVSKKLGNQTEEGPNNLELSFFVRREAVCLDLYFWRKWWFLTTAGTEAHSTWCESSYEACKPLLCRNPARCFPALIAVAGVSRVHLPAHGWCDTQMESLGHSKPGTMSICWTLALSIYFIPFVATLTSLGSPELQC